MSRGSGCRKRPQHREAGQVRQTTEERPESVVSDLITSAIQYGKEPVRLRPIRDHEPASEAFDGSNTRPRLSCARTTR